MHRVGRLLMLLLLSAATVVSAAEVRPGDQVRFIERDQQIPAPPAPGDSPVHLRFVSGSQATVLHVDAATGWIEVQGEPLQGSEHTGWITSRYLARTPSTEDPASDTLAWCPTKGSLASHPSGRLRLATWNLENLHAPDSQSTYTESDPSVKRTATDYERIRCYVRLFDPDILAVQEVDGEAALSRVVDTDVYDVHVDDRPKGSLNGQQNTGFAVKRGLTVVRQPDFTALDIRGDGSLRYDTRIDLTRSSAPPICRSETCGSHGCAATIATHTGVTTVARVSRIGWWLTPDHDGTPIPDGSNVFRTEPRWAGPIRMEMPSA